MLVPLESCNYLADLDLYVKFTCMTPGLVGITVGEDELCLDHVFAASVRNGQEV